MTDEISIESREYFSSKRAAELSGYTQDYIGQLARCGEIEARRIGGLWYVRMDSLQDYKKKSERYKPEPPKPENEAHDTLVSFEGKDYISASRASKLTGYHQDYVTQLARTGKVLSRQVGTRWYLDRKGVVEHKKEKDALLAAVQAEAVGLAKNKLRSSELENLSYAGSGPFYTYITEEKDLIPSIGKRDVSNNEETSVQQVPIRVVRSQPRQFVYPDQDMKGHQTTKRRMSGKTIFYGSLAASALTIVIVLSFGFPSIRQGSTYALTAIRETAAASLSDVRAPDFLAQAVNALEQWLVPEVMYKRQ